MQRVFAALFLLLTFLFCFAESASARAQLQPENRVGVFSSNPNISTYAIDPLALQPQWEDTTSGYDFATGVVFYVNQNPWTKFDPHGLEGAAILQTHWIAHQQSQTTGKPVKEILNRMNGRTGVDSVEAAAELAAQAFVGTDENLNPVKAKKRIEAGIGFAILIGLEVGGPGGKVKAGKKALEEGVEFVATQASKKADDVVETARKNAPEGGGNRTQGTRYVGEGEAGVIDSTGRVPNTNAAGDPKTVFYTHDKPLSSAAEAQKAYNLPTKPTHRVTVDTRSAKPGSAGNVEGGTGVELMTDKSLPAKKIQPLDD